MILRAILIIALLLLSAAACATVFWASCVFDRDKRRRDLVSRSVDEAIEQFDRENCEE